MFAARTTLDPSTAPYAALLLRLTLGVVFLAHGLFKVLVLGLPATAAFFVDHGFPGWTAYPVFAAEVLGGAALLAGIHTRLVSLALLPVVMGAFTVHWPNGWYFGAPHGGWEYLAVLAAALLVQAGLAPRSTRAATGHPGGHGAHGAHGKSGTATGRTGHTGGYDQRTR